MGTARLSARAPASASGLTDGEYQLQAVATNNSSAADPAPGFVSVIVDNVQGDNYEDADVDGHQYKTEKIPFGIPGSLMMNENMRVVKVICKNFNPISNPIILNIG